MPNTKNFTKTIGLLSGYFTQIKQIEQLIRKPLAGVKDNFPIFETGDIINLHNPESVYELTNIDFGDDAPKKGQKGKVVSMIVATAAKVVGTEWFWEVKYELMNMKGKPYTEPKYGKVLYSFDPRAPFSK